MMQHYRTHMSPKSRRSQKRGAAEEARPRPRLHAHHRIKSDPVRVEPPLTIDQHLSNYHQSLRSSPLGSSSTASERHTAVRFNFPLPLSSTARSASSLKKLNSPSPIPMINIQQQKHQETSTPSPTLSHSSSSTSLPSIHHMIDDTNMSSRATSPDNINNNTLYDKEDTPTTATAATTTNNISVSPSNSTSNLFYQHRPLTFTRPQNSSFPFTLLHPVQAEEDSNVVRNRSSGKEDEDNNSRKDDPMDEDEDATSDSKSPSSGGLLQLAHIVSTFG